MRNKIIASDFAACWYAQPERSGVRRSRTPMNSIEFEPSRLRRVAVAVVATTFWGVSLCAAQETQGTSSLDVKAPPTLLADQIARFASTSAAQAPDQTSW